MALYLDKQGVHHPDRVGSSRRKRGSVSEKTIKVGDVVAWADVPDGALVRYGDRYYVRLPDDRGWWVGATGRPWAVFGRGPAIPGEETAGRRERGWTWSWHNDNEPVTIVALGLTGRESADDLRRMAEVFEVREASASLPFMLMQRAMGPVDDPMTADGIGQAAERLHAAGWRPGMTAEDAARLLSEGR